MDAGPAGRGPSAPNRRALSPDHTPRDFLRLTLHLLWTQYALQGCRTDYLRRSSHLFHLSSGEVKQLSTLFYSYMIGTSNSICLNYFVGVS